MLMVPSEDTIRRYLKLLVTGAIAMIVVIVLGIVLSTVQKSWASLEKQVRSGLVPSYTEGDWAIRPLGDATVEAPFHFGPGPDYLAMMTPEDRSVMEFSETYQSQGPTNSFGVQVLRRGMKAHIAPDLDKSLRGPLLKMAQALKDPNPQFAFQPAIISGRRALIASYHKGAQPDGKPKHVLAASVVEGTLIWQITIIYDDEATTPDAERILKSFKIR